MWLILHLQTNMDFSSQTVCFVYDGVVVFFYIDGLSESLSSDIVGNGKAWNYIVDMISKSLYAKTNLRYLMHN